MSKYTKYNDTLVSKNIQRMHQTKQNDTMVSKNNQRMHQNISSPLPPPPPRHVSFPADFIQFKENIPKHERIETAKQYLNN